ncbi:MAG: single-stranded-DNA-specific exonuclease RecJ [Thermotogae bacterium]|nr:single-stranded-DNA-specific exonuclease RecJ [Thermotogota bacterium]
MALRYRILPPDVGEEGEARSRAFRQLLYNRKVRRGLDLSRLNLSKVHDPFLMAGMAEATERVKRAIERGERILIHGDYDADGITALTLLVYALRWLGADVIPFVPDRFRDGYGLSRRGVEFARKRGAKLIITADCGVSSHAEVGMAKEYEIDVIITDHHQLPESLPNGAIVVHPAVGGRYPDTDLTGVGVAFKFALALYERMGKDKSVLYFLLDLVAVGTVADVGLMLGENRLLVKHGLRLMRLGRHVKLGLQALIRQARVHPPIGTWNIAWQIAPRINAAGRMGNSDLAMNLLISNSEREVENLARRLNDLNNLRRRRQEELLRVLMEEASTDSPIVFVVREDVDEGIAGILAGKLLHHFSKPAVVVSVSGGVAKGSLRSLEPFNVYEALRGAASLFGEGDNFGGHPLAGGFRLGVDRLEALRRRLEDYARRVLPEGRLVKVLYVDAEVEPGELDAAFWEDYGNFRPYGQGFPRPVLAIKFPTGPTYATDRYVEYVGGGKVFRFRLPEGVAPPSSGILVVEDIRWREGRIEGDIVGFLP